jgi:type I restriction enzyme, S subunit
MMSDDNSNKNGKSWLPIQDSHPLPPGWRWVKLGDICEIIAGQSPPGSTYRVTPEGPPFFQGKADFGLLNPVARVWCVEPIKIALPGDILISVRAPVGPTNVANVRCCIGRGLAAIRCTQQVDQEFLLLALRMFESKLAQRGSGSTFEAISRNDLVNFKIPIPHIDEQKRIAGVLNEKLTMVERARVAAEAQLKIISDLPAVFLRRAFKGEL